MSKHYETVTVPAKTETRCTSVTCDVCRQASGYLVGSEVSWFGGGACDVKETEVRWNSGSNWGGDGGAGTAVHVHVCPACFEHKLIPWLRSQGGGCGEPTREEWSW